MQNKRAFGSRVRTLLVSLFWISSAIGMMGAASEPTGPKVSKPLLVQSQLVEEKSAPEWAEFHGSVRSRTKVDVIAHIMGRVKAVHVKAGQQVAAGDLLLELDPAEMQAKLAAAESRQVAAEAVAMEAHQAFGRIQSLFPQGAATQQELDEATARHKSALAALEAARAQVKESREFLRYTEVKSPISGVVVDKRVNPGDFSVPGLAGAQGFASGPTLMTIYDPAALWFECSIPERFSRSVTVGSKAWLDIGPTHLEVEGSFVEVVPGVDEFNRTFIGRVDLPPSPALKLGMLGRMRFVIGERKSIEAPTDAVVARGQLDSVFVITDGKARLRLVRPGKRTPGGIEILAGLKAGERVILNPPENLRDGDVIENGGTTR